MIFLGSFSFSFSSTFFFNPVFSNEIIEPFASFHDLLPLVVWYTSSVSFSSLRSLFVHFLDIFGEGISFSRLTLKPERFGSFIFHARNIRTTRAAAMTIIMIFDAPVLASPKTLCNNHKTGHDIYQPCARHSFIFKSCFPPSARRGKLRIAETNMVASIHCLIVVPIIPCFKSTPTPASTHNKKNTDNHCSPNITEKTLFATSRIGEPSAKKSAKKYNHQITSRAIPNCFLEIAIVVRVLLFLVLLFVKTFF